jgi:hypothetical protein
LQVAETIVTEGLRGFRDSHPFQALRGSWL